MPENIIPYLLFLVHNYLQHVYFLALPWPFQTRISLLPEQRNVYHVAAVEVCLFLLVAVTPAVLFCLSLLGFLLANDGAVADMPPLPVELASHILKRKKPSFMAISHKVFLLIPW